MTNAFVRLSFEMYSSSLELERGRDDDMAWRVRNRIDTPSLNERLRRNFRLDEQKVELMIRF